MTMLNRSGSAMPAGDVLSKTERQLIILFRIAQSIAA